MLAMLKNPGVQLKAQAEIDSVLGFGTLPTFLDKEKLPYINAIMYETLRWHSTVPGGAFSIIVLIVCVNIADRSSSSKFGR